MSKKKLNLKSPKINKSSVINAAAFRPIKQQCMSMPYTIPKEKKKQPKELSKLIYFLTSISW